MLEEERDAAKKECHEAKEETQATKDQFAAAVRLWHDKENNFVEELKATTEQAMASICKCNEEKRKHEEVVSRMGVEKAKLKKELRTVVQEKEELAEANITLRDQIFECLGFCESLTRVDFLKEIEEEGLEKYNVENLEEVLKAQFPDGPPPLIRERMAEDEREQEEVVELDANMQEASATLAIEAAPMDANTPQPTRASPIVVELDTSPENAEETNKEDLPATVEENPPSTELENPPTMELNSEGLPASLPDTSAPANAP